MAVKWEYPSQEELKKLYEKLGTAAAVARHLGIPVTTFREFVTREGMRDLPQGEVRRPTVNPVEDRAIDHPERLQAERQKDEIKILRKENREYAKRLASEEEFFDRIVETVGIERPQPKYKRKTQSGKKPVISVVAPIYDQQFGQFVRPTDTPGGQGNYSVEVFDHRLARWVEGVTGVIRDRATSYRVDELIIPFGGDHIEGDEIFAGQPWQLELDPPQQVWELSLKMDAAIQEIVAFAKEEVGIPKIGLYGVDDNHGKVGGKRGGARPATYSWNWLFLKILFDRLKNQPITQMAIEPGGALFFRCAMHEFQMIHGHQIRGWGGLPFYGLTKFDGRSIRMHSRIYRYLLMGHHHQAGEVPNGAGETIISGDWVGANNLSGLITAASRPQQKLLFVSEKWGIMGTERIYFAEADEAYAPSPLYDLAVA